MNKAKLTAGITLIFLLGVVAGALAVQIYHKYDNKREPRRHLSLEKRVEFIVKKMGAELDLTAEQKSRIRPHSGGWGKGDLGNQKPYRSGDQKNLRSILCGHQKND